MESPLHKQGKPHFTSRQHRAIIAAITGSGSFIVNQDELLEPELSVNNILKIRSGMLIHHGDVCIVPPGTYDQVTYLNGTQAMKRIDLVVYRYTKPSGNDIEKGEWVVIQGTPHASSPEVPAHTVGNMQNGDLVDDCPMFELHFDGINVTEVKKLLEVTTNICELKQEITQLNNKLFQNVAANAAYTNSSTEVEKTIDFTGAKGVMFCVWNGSVNYNNPCYLPIQMFGVGSNVQVSYDGINATFKRNTENTVKLKTTKDYALIYTIK